MKLKNVLLTGLSFVLVTAVAIGGTLAYLTSTDDDVNVMTLGNVSIAQHEYERVVDANGNYATDTINSQTSYVLKDFTQGKPLLPATELDANGNPANHGAGNWDTTKVDMSQVGSQGTQNVFTSKNAQDKIVTVKNTGKSDAYVRTWIALEDPFTENRIGVNVGSSAYYTQTSWTTVEIDGVKYSVSCFTYKEALKPGEVSTPSLFQVYLNYKATNEDMELLGDTYEILAFSQAVQADDFTAAAGKTAAETALEAAFGTDHPWADGVNVPVTVSSADELEDAFENGGTVILTDDITVPATLRVEPGVAVNLVLNGRTITVPDNSTSSAFNALFYSENGSDISISGNGIVDLGENGMSLVVTRGNVTIENGTFTRKVTDPNSAYPLISDSKYADGKGTTVINGGYFDAGYYDVNAKTFGETTADEATRGMPGDKNRYRVAIKDNITGTLNFSKSTFKVYGGTFVGANPAWGDEGCAMPITPNYERPWSYYQGTFLDGQQVYDDRIEIPAGYTITEGTTTDGRPTYTVNYSK